ncbi:MAG: hypothetical protein SD837_15475 [Candidatus Electrothrix scaldis]|nr:MAG: hypothetical protein SD837_15475 [Candidatus Electrothrix sp. GW3-3]
MKPVPYLSGLDFLKVSLHLDWKKPEFKALLKEMKEQFNDDHINQNPEAPCRPLDFVDGMSFNMQPFGAGKYPYVLKSGDITLLFSNHKADAQFPNCRIEIGSMSCWHPGWYKLFNVITSWLRGFGAEIVQQKVTEFHITADLLGVEYSSTDFANLSRWVYRANRFGINGEDYTPNYISFGKGDFMFRCYGKTSELDPQSAKYDFFHDLWREHTGDDVQHVTRLEFQLRRTVIKSLGIKTVGDLAQKLNAVWAYCVGDGEENSGWCRFLDRAMSESDRKNKNHQRYDTATLWETVRNVRFNEGRTFHLVREKTQHLDVERLTKMMAGCGSSLCGAVGLHDDDLEGHINFAKYLLEEQMRNNYRKSRNEYRRKIQTKYNAAEIAF